MRRMAFLVPLSHTYCLSLSPSRPLSVSFVLLILNIFEHVHIIYVLGWNRQFHHVDENEKFKINWNIDFFPLICSTHRLSQYIFHYYLYKNVVILGQRKWNVYYQSIWPNIITKWELFEHLKCTWNENACGHITLKLKEIWRK